MPPPTAPDPLRQAFQDGDLVLYLGAGASMASGLPSWENLVLSLYFASITSRELGARPFANYLYAIAEWHLRNVRQPADVVARKIRRRYDSDEAFVRDLREILYAGVSGPDATPQRLLDTNATLAALAELCRASKPGRGVDAVISYNYDDLLETVLGDACQPVWTSAPPDGEALPVFHVHGYLPRDGEGSRYADILLSEEQYHRAAHDVYSWSNVVQIRYLTSSVGLMVGLSLTDPNMRRLLDAVVRTPVAAPAYALLPRPRRTDLDEPELARIHERAQEYLERFRRSGSPEQGQLRPGVKGADWQHEVQQIIWRVEETEVDRQAELLSDLGVTVIWYDDHDEIPAFLASIAA